MKPRYRWRSERVSYGLWCNVRYILFKSPVKAPVAIVTQNQRGLWYWHTMLFHKYHNAYQAGVPDLDVAKKLCLEWILAADGGPMKLRDWAAALLRCKTLEDYKTVLTGFHAQSGWTLEERSMISAVYTPPVVKMVRDLDDKWKWLEEFAQLCWDKK